MKYFLISLLFCMSSCSFSEDKIPNFETEEFTYLPEDLIINLRWSASFEEETKERAEIGLQWILSYLGAMLPPGSFEKAIEWQDDYLFTINLAKVGFTERTKRVWAKLLAELKTSEEYDKMNSIDLGRFYLLTFNSSWHYYALTNVSPSFEAFEKKYEFEPPINLLKGESGVARGCRIIYHAKDTSRLDKMGYYAIEGTGDIDRGNFKPKDYEVFDFMPNGQTRFAIYDEYGKLKAAADKGLGIAGKPSKCMWCHESNIQLSFVKDKNQKLIDFNVDVQKRRDNLIQHQRQIETEIFYDSLAHHRNGEFPFGSFMDCNIKRIANEFEVDTLAIKKFVEQLPTHTTRHFPEFGEYYERKDIEDLQPYEAIKPPTKMWEKSEYEPNFFIGRK